MATRCCSFAGGLPSAPGKPLVSPMRLCFYGISSSSAAHSSGGSRKVPVLLARASVVNSSESSYGFAKRMELAWLISKDTVVGLVVLSGVWTTGSLKLCIIVSLLFFMLLKIAECSIYLMFPRLKQQPKPIACSTCESNGYVECKWCAGTGFFILGNQMLCEVPSRNTACVICTGKGSAACRDCKGTGFRAKWLEDPPPSK
ncbi:hypothetical protein ZIOFF_049403 [Zingiber officinale]|uniref:Uncharacterized protein n=1 Tax=Zingiber officinale TaxID=94328 RepID=A0A8J5FST7_ZINOF|nr:hypothetical protein ZIOFF_049403 [Zingiber officinale]